MTSSNDRLDRIETLVASNAKAIEALTSNIATNTADIASTRASVDGLVQTITEFSIRTEARLNKLDESIEEIKTTNQNLERILERLTRGDGNGRHGG